MRAIVFVVLISLSVLSVPRVYASDRRSVETEQYADAFEIQNKGVRSVETNYDDLTKSYVIRFAFFDGQAKAASHFTLKHIGNFISLEILGQVVSKGALIKEELFLEEKPELTIADFSMQEAQTITQNFRSAQATMKPHSVLIRLLIEKN